MSKAAAPHPDTLFSQSKTARTVKTVADLTALKNPRAGNPAKVVTDGVAELWTFDDSDLSAEVAADEEGALAPPDFDASGASGAWKVVHESGVIIGEHGKKFRLASTGVLRNNAGTWEFLNDATHEPVGNISVSNPTPTVLRLSHKFSGKNLFAIAVPDETYARMGMTCGISSSPGEADLSCYLPFEFKLTTDGSNDPTMTIIPELASRVDAVVRNGFNLRVVHTGGVTDAPQCTSLNGVTVPVVVEHTAASLEINQHSPGSYSYRARYTSGAWEIASNDQAGPSLDASSFGSNGNLVFSGMTATAPPYGNAPNSPNGNGRAITWTQTGVTARIYDAAGNPITAPTEGMELSFSRGGGLVPNGSTSLPSGSVLVRRGRIPCDFSDLVSPASIGGFPN
ncbi:MAG TPA: hypothetical protein EYG20_02755, partial [Alcanivorax sp.]|nr:hypothetical protein [Alcanivorax sp.]